SVAWICGLLHSQLTSTGDWPLRVVAAPRSPDSGAPEYFGRIVVAEHSPVRHFGDLAGTRFAYNEESSLSGYRMMLDRLADTGADLGFFGGVVRSGSHVGSLRLVAEGTADCAIIDSIVLDDLDPPGFRIIESVGPYPAPPLTASQTASGLLSAAVDTHTWAFADESAYVSLRKRGPAGG
ncbi:MAG: PhnD/SsuA/transferrin family substrate-binding protein, partial [Acidimicrobiia bacterium]|nr:PhnD/SsuA/transferrin family substrate-binding protein [Acidimicrobiia bacterium]